MNPRETRGPGSRRDRGSDARSAPLTTILEGSVVLCCEVLYETIQRDSAGGLPLSTRGQARLRRDFPEVRIGLVIGLSDRLTRQDRLLVTGYIEVARSASAGTDRRRTVGIRTTANQGRASDMIALAELIEMGTREPNALSFCPDR